MHPRGLGAGLRLFKAAAWCSWQGSSCLRAWPMHGMQRLQGVIPGITLLALHGTSFYRFYFLSAMLRATLLCHDRLCCCVGPHTPLATVQMYAMYCDRWGRACDVRELASFCCHAACSESGCKSALTSCSTALNSPQPPSSQPRHFHSAQLSALTRPLKLC